MSRQRRSGHEEPEAGEEGPLDHGRLRWHRPPLRLSSTAVRLATAVVAVVIPGVSVVPTLLVYFLLGYLLPETDEY